MAPRKTSRRPRRIAVPQVVRMGGSGYDHAEAEQITRTLCERLTFVDGELTDPSPHRSRIQRDPRSLLHSLCSGLALALVGAHAELAEVDAKRKRRKLWKQERRQCMTIIGKLKAFQTLDGPWLADELNRAVKQTDEAHPPDLRVATKEICDNVLLQCRDLIERYTRLRGDAAWEKVGIMLNLIDVVSFNGDSMEPLYRRFERLSPAMKQHWKRRHSA